MNPATNILLQSGIHAIAKVAPIATKVTPALMPISIALTAVQIYKHLKNNKNKEKVINQ